MIFLMALQDINTGTSEFSEDEIDETRANVTDCRWARVAVGDYDPWVGGDSQNVDMALT